MKKEILKNGLFCFTDDNHKFTLDSLIISELITDFDYMCELCAGTGVIGLSSVKKDCRIDFVETDESAYNLLKSAIIEQNLRFTSAFLEDARNFAANNTGKYDMVVFNPPYYKADAGILPSNPFLAKQKFELQGTLFEFIQAAKQLLCENGRLLFSVKPERKNESLKYINKLGLFTADIFDFHYETVKPPFLTVITATKCPTVTKKQSVFLYEQGKETKFYKNLYKFEDE